jgi:hypothetical protein
VGWKIKATDLSVVHGSYGIYNIVKTYIFKS